MNIVGKYKTLQIVILLFLVNVILGQSKKIAISIDDLPCTNCSSIEIIENVNNSILTTLCDFEVPAIGFVNESKLYSRGKLDTRKVNTLRNWINNDLELGNHTFSHLNINKVSIAEFEEDMLRGELITKPLLQNVNKELKYFRHPQLKTGSTHGIKKELDSLILAKGYTIAPVTMDHDEYIYAYCYRKAKAINDSATVAWIATEYIDYMKQIFSHYENLSVEYLGYNMNHIILLHTSELNSENLGELLGHLIERGYAFISIGEALTDPAYLLPEAPTERGISWINRWQLAAGEKPTEQPKLPDDISACFKHFKSNESMPFYYED